MIDKSSIQNYLRPLEPIPTSSIPSGEPIRDIRCVLFDIYGTLFISGSGDIGLAKKNSPQHAELRALLAKCDIPQAPQTLLHGLHDAIQARHEQLHRRGIEYPEVKIDRIWQQVLQVDDQRRIWQFAVEFELIANPVYPMPHLAQLLTTCRRQGLTLGIISNAQFYTPYLFNWFLDTDLPDLGFDADLTFYSYRFEIAKPSSALFEMAAKKLMDKEIQPASVLYIGNDMLNDIFPAQKVGFKTALFAGDQRSLRLRADDPRCRELTPDLVVTDLGQLIGLIGAKVV